MIGDFCIKQVKEIIVDETQIATRTDEDIIYRGYRLRDLVKEKRITFEHVCFLLVKGELPTSDELYTLKFAIVKGRHLDGNIKILLQKCKDYPIRELVKTALILAPVHGSIIEKLGFLLGFIPSLMAYAYFLKQANREINTVASVDVTVAAHILGLFRPELAVPVTATSKVEVSTEASVLDCLLITLAEIGMSVDSFAARCSASTETDYISMMLCAISTRMSSLNRPQECCNVVMNWSLDEIKEGVEKGTVNFGWIKFNGGDPRIDSIRSVFPFVLSTSMIEKCYAIEQILKENPKQNVQPNIAIYGGVLIQAIGLPKEVIDMLYIVSRLGGWSAHVREQLLDNRLIRPRSNYVGYQVRNFEEDLEKIKKADLENNVSKSCDFSSPNTKENPIVMSRNN